MTRLRCPRLRVLPAAALPAAVTLVLALAAPASAGTYTVWSCRGPEGAALDASAWQGEGAADACATGGALSAHVDEDGVAGAVFLAPPGTRITRYRANLTAATRDAPLHEAAAQAGLAEGGPLGAPAVAAGCADSGCTFGDEQDPLGPAGAIDREADPGLSALTLVASCAQLWLWGCGHGRDGGDGPAAVARLWRSAVELTDERAPVIDVPSGSLLDAPASGRASLAAAARDTGGGVAEVTLLVDGAPAGRVRPGGACAEPYTTPAPCPADVPARFELDTSGLAAGPHTAIVRARDAAGAETLTDPLTFRVAAPPAPTPPTVPPAPAAGGVEAVVVQAPAPALLAATVTVARRRVAPGGTVRGVVRLAGGGPASGARLVVAAHRFGPGDPPERTVGTAVTGADGAFSVPAGRTARALVVRLDDPAYRPAASPPVRVAGSLRIEGTPSPDRLRNGQVLTLRVRLDGAGPGAAALRQVLVQALVGGRWSTVDSIEARADGRAVWRYRFRRTTTTARYLFRLRVPAGAEDWPFPTTVSPVVRVTVRP